MRLAPVGARSPAAVAVAVGFVLAASPARADRVVTLAEAYRLAGSQNLDLVVARTNIDRADALVRQAWGLLQPNVSGDVTYTFRDQETTRDLGGGEEVVLTPRDSFSANLTARQALFNAQSMLLLGNARDNRDASSLDVDAARNQIYLATARAYYTVITGRRVVEVGRELKGVAEANLRAAQARFDAGTGLRIDVTRAEIDVQAAERGIAVAEAAWQDARDGLGLVLGLEDPVDAAEATIAPPTVPDVDRAAGVARRPELRAASLRTNIADRAVDAAYWALAPSLDAIFSLNWTDAAGAFGRETQWQVLAVLTVPIYDGVRYGVITERKADRTQAEAQQERLRLQVRSEIRSADRAVQSQGVAVRTAERQVELARQAVDQSSAAYQAGASTNLEVIQAQQALRDAEVTLALAQAEWRLAVVRLMVSAGLQPAA